MVGRTWRMGVGTLVAGCAISLASLGGVAQDAGPMAGEAATPGTEGTPIGTMAQEGSVAYPAHIHAGTCDALGEIVFPLSDVGIPASAEGTPAVTSAPAGATDAIPAYVSNTLLAAPVDQILSSPHAINVHLSADEIDTYIACGNIGGVQYGNTIQFGIAELNDSGFHGIALISGDPGTDANVAVYLAPTGAGAMAATPAP